MNWCLYLWAVLPPIPCHLHDRSSSAQIKFQICQIRSGTSIITSQISWVSPNWSFSDIISRISMKTSHPGQVNQWAFCKLRAVIIIFGSVIMAEVMMVIDVDCSQSIRSLERSILGFPIPSAPYFIVRQNSLPDGNTSDILRNASQVNCPTLQHTASILQSEVLENAKTCIAI